MARPSQQPIPSDAGGGLRLFRATIAYDGSGFHGWAAQPGLRTVELTLGEALARVTRQDHVPLTCAGRTDAGVHARGQVVHFAVPDGVEPERLRRSANAVLPPDVRVREVGLAPDGFDARFSAVWREYQYRVTDGVPDPLSRHMVLAVPRPLRVSAMREAVAPLIGLHDFGSFCKPRPGATTIREVLACDWARRSDGELRFTVRADAFCHSMVRSIVGASIEVGIGRRPAGWLAELLAAPSRLRAAPVAPPHGLVLVEVGYPPDAELAARAAAARRLRTRGA